MTNDAVVARFHCGQNVIVLKLLPTLKMGVLENRMTINLVWIPFVAAFAMVGLSPKSAADTPSGSGVIQISREKVAELAFASPQGGQLLATNNFKVMMLRRAEAGKVEIHDYDTDIFYVLEGTATFVTGGKVIDPKTTRPGETRAPRSEGGEERKLTKGDVIVIPNGVPHWFSKVTEPFLYYVVKVSK